MKERHTLTSPCVSIVFLNYNRLEETRITMEKLFECKRQYENLEIIAVDNGSEDGTGDFLLQHAEEIIPVILDENIGIEGYNHAFRKASGEYFIVLDDDSHIQPSTIHRVIQVFESDETIGLIAFKVVDKRGVRFNTWHLPADDSFQDSFAFVGCGFAVRRDVFSAIGYFPGEYFLYHNEIEVALQIKLQGMRVVYDPECIAMHRTGGQSRNPSRRIYFTLKNSLILIWKYYPVSLALYLTASRIVISFSLALAHVRFLDFFRGLNDFVRQFPRRSPLSVRECRLYLDPFTRHNSLFHRVLGLLL